MEIVSFILLVIKECDATSCCNSCLAPSKIWPNRPKTKGMPTLAISSFSDVQGTQSQVIQRVLFKGGKEWFEGESVVVERQCKSGLVFSFFFFMKPVWYKCISCLFREELRYFWGYTLIQLSLSVITV